MPDFTAVEAFLKDRKNANQVVDLVNSFQETVPNIYDFTQSLNNLFSTLFKRGDFKVDPELRLTNPKAFEIEETYSKWLYELYLNYFNKLLHLLDVEIQTSKEEIILNLLSLLSAEVKSNLSPIFPCDKLEKIIKTILLAKKKDVIISYATFLKNCDLYFYTWKILKEALTLSSDNSELYIGNLLELLGKIADPPSEDVFCYQEPSDFQYRDELVKKWKQKVWMILTNRKMSPAIHRKLLLVLLEGYIAQLRKPTLLTDFLSGSLSLGGVTGVLALQGMSVLVTKHNLECPNIFAKLYNMFQPEIFSTRFLSRLFYLADIFLQSTYISEQLVAAFIKRLSRLSLIAQAPDQILIIQFVGNLLIRHPATSVLIHSSTSDSADSDPFDMDEKDPVKSRALESSLWELALLKNHVQPKVAAAAKFLDNSMPSMEWDIRDQLDSSYVKMFESEIKKNAKEEPAVTFVRPTDIAQLREDRLYKMWSLT